MRQVGKRPVTLFCHLPKTGGTTVTRLLTESLGLRYVGARPVAGRTTYSPADLRRDLRIAPWARCVGGHPLKPHVDLDLPDRDVRWVTLLRDPIKRYLSHYQHQYDRGLERYRLPIDEWGTRFNRSDLMVRWIAGEANVERAKEVLEERFDIVGTLENLDPFLTQLQEAGLLRDSVNSSVPPSNVAPSTAAKDEVLRGWDRYGPFVEEANALDMDLYRYVESRWGASTLQQQPVGGEQACAPARLPISVTTLSARVFNQVVLRPGRRLEEMRATFANTESV